MSDLTNMHADNMDLVVFTIDGVMCALKIDEVQEIKRVIQINYVHQAPDYVCGVINLRGQIVTVIDLRKRLNYPAAVVSEKSRLVVVKRCDEQIGLLVDTIEDAVIAKAEDILGPPSNIQGVEDRFFMGVYKTPETLVTILDLKEILEKEEKVEG
jgi:purine-binding chemotaxis protein CheW